MVVEIVYFVKSYFAFEQPINGKKCLEHRHATRTK